MRFSDIFKELTYTEMKVLVYCATHKDERNATGFGRWLGMSYTAAIDAWKRGISGLEEKGYMREGSWTSKAKDAIQGKS